MRRRRIVVTGIGLLCPLGDRPLAVHRALCAGTNGLQPLKRIERDGLGDLQAGELSDFDAASYLGKRGLRGMDRSSRLTAAAASLALADAGLLADGVAQGEVGLVLGTMLSGVCTTSRFDRRAVTAGPSYAKPMDFANTVINAAAGQTAIRLDLRGLNVTVASGAASGPQAIGYAADLIRSGRSDALLAGGMEELSWESLLAFRGGGLLAGNGNGAPPVPVPCERRRNGFALGEAAAFLLLEEAAAARARGARPLAEIVGHGSAFEPLDRGVGHQGFAATTRAVRAALADAELGADALDALSLSASGSPAGDLAEGRGLEEALGRRLASLPVTAPKAALGESLGAGGAAAAALLVVALRDGVLPGVRGLAEPDPALPYPTLSAECRPLSGRRGLVSARGLDGKSAALVVETGVAA